MSERDTRDEQDIEAIVELFESEPNELSARGDAGPDEITARIREYAEVAGLLPYELDPEEPRAEIKARLMAAIGQRSASSSATAAMRSSVAVSSATVVPFSAGREERGGRGVQLLAAAMVFLALALAATTGWLFATVRAQGERIAVLHDNLRSSRTMDRQLLAVRQDLAQLRGQFALVTQPGVEVCPLRPHGDAPAQPDARGLFYISPDRRRWVLTASDLKPCDQGSHYRVWFQTDDGAVSGAVFQALAGGARIEIGADNLPEGTRAIIVTLEVAPDPGSPSGPPVLYGDDTGAMIL